MFDLSQEEDEQILDKGIFVGVDGCKGGWITAIISNGELSLKKYSDFSKMVFDTAQFDGMLVDIYMNPAAVLNYEKWGGEKLIGRSLMECHNQASREKIQQWVLFDSVTESVYEKEVDKLYL